MLVFNLGGGVPLHEVDVIRIFGFWKGGQEKALGLLREEAGGDWG